MHVFSTERELVTHLRDTGAIIWTDPDGSLFPWPEPDGGRRLALAVPVGSSRSLNTDHQRDGLTAGDSDITVAEALSIELVSRAGSDGDSLFWRHTLRSFERSFVFIDISDFSQFKSPMQLMVVQSLIAMAKEANQPSPVYQEPWEAQLCIGDGYVFAFADSLAATGFAARFADLTEHAIAKGEIPEFHFRIGVHTGDVRFFWDPGRGDYNYIGDGINDASRVLTAIGKKIDDVIFVSSSVRQRLSALPREAADEIRAAMENKGRRADKHGKLHRVYQLNHVAMLRSQ